MDHNLTKLLDEAIKIELGISKLYQVFSEEIVVDRDFWWKLALEEVNHASILRAGKEMVSMDRFPKDIIPDSFEDLVISNLKIMEAQLEFRTNPQRIKAFELAFHIENSASELHYQKYLGTEEMNGVRKIFQQLNRDDIDHAKRIKERWEMALQEIGD